MVISCNVLTILAVSFLFITGLRVIIAIGLRGQKGKKTDILPKVSFHK